MKLVFLGPPGAGKGTQAALLAKKTGWAHLATGDLFRQAVARGDKLGGQVAGYMEKGLLVPDEIVIALIRQALPENRGFILDGFPRTLEQAQALEKALAGKGVDRAVYLRLPEEEAVRRLSGRLTCSQCQAPYNVYSSPPQEAGKCDRCGGELVQRPDDREEAVRKRLEVYLTETAPVLEYYKREGKLVEVEAGGGVEAVAETIQQVLRIDDGDCYQVPPGARPDAAGRPDSG